MLRNSIVMTGPRKSAWQSPFAVFEKFNSWSSLREDKKLVKGMYFAVIVTPSKCIDIIPDLFIQGYRPHSSGANIHVQKRRYGEFIPCPRQPGEPTYQDDIVFQYAQLYQVREGNEVELILRDGLCFAEDGSVELIKRECETEKGIQRLVNRICGENSFEKLSNLKQYRYHCPVSAGYFLAQRSYHVWSILVGENTGFSFNKKVLIMDFHTGIPAVVDYDDRHFEKIS